MFQIQSITWTPWNSAVAHFALSGLSAEKITEIPKDSKQPGLPCRHTKYGSRASMLGEAYVHHQSLTHKDDSQEGPVDIVLQEQTGMNQCGNSETTIITVKNARRMVEYLDTLMANHA